MRLEPRKYYEMPLVKAPSYDLVQLPGLPYPDTEVLALQYLTDPSAIRALLPECYEVGSSPLVTIVFGHNNGLDFMAGGSYRLAAVQVAARFDGEQDRVEGDYTVVMFENETRPILGGRELLGVPKQHADITPVRRMPGGTLRCEASLWGHFLFGIDVSAPRKQNALVRLVAKGQLNSRPWLAYKYIPSLDGPPDADYPAITWNETRLDELWMGRTGGIRVGTATEEDVGCFKGLLDALERLPVHKVERALRFKGSAVLRLDRSRRLR